MNPKRVCYYHASTSWKHLGQHHLSQQNQLQLAFDLSLEHGFHNKLKLFRPPTATLRQLNAFHSLPYLQFLQQADENARPEAAKKFGIYDSCLQTEETFGYYRLIAGATIAAAEKLNSDQADIAINWSGGFHQALKSQAYGCSYINDVVLAITELLKRHCRVVYINIGFTYCDTVQKVFCNTDRVMMISFYHKQKNYDRNTDWTKEIEIDQQNPYSLYIPLLDDINVASCHLLFQPIISKVMEYYQPQAIIFQSSTEFLAQGNINDFYSTLDGHGVCIQFLKNFDIPILLLGGGDCNAENAAVCWIYLTAIAICQDLYDIIPCSNWYKHDIPSHSKKEIQYTNNLICRQYLAVLENIPLEILNSRTTRISRDSPLSNGSDDNQVTTSSKCLISNDSDSSSDEENSDCDQENAKKENYTSHRKGNLDKNNSNVNSRNGSEEIMSLGNHDSNDNLCQTSTSINRQCNCANDYHNKVTPIIFNITKFIQKQYTYLNHLLNEVTVNHQQQISPIRKRKKCNKQETSLPKTKLLKARSRNDEAYDQDHGTTSGEDADDDCTNKSYFSFNNGSPSVRKASICNHHQDNVMTSNNCHQINHRKRSRSSKGRHSRPAKKRFNPNSYSDGDICNSHIIVNTPTSMMNKSDREEKNNNIMAEADTTCRSNSHRLYINSNKTHICNCCNYKLDSAAASTSSLNQNNHENSNVVISECCSLFKSSLDLIRTLIQRTLNGKPMSLLSSPSARSLGNITPNQDTTSVSLWDMSSKNEYDKRTHSHENSTPSQDTTSISLWDMSSKNEYDKCLQDIGQLSIQDRMRNNIDLESNSATSIKCGLLVDHRNNNLFKNFSEDDCCKDMEVCDSQFTQLLTKDCLKSDHRYCLCKQPSHPDLENEIHHEMIEKLTALNLLN